MKIFFTALIFIYFVSLKAQYPCSNFHLDFVDTTCMQNLIIDTAGNSNNIWQVGLIQKDFLTSQYGNGIITDTLNPYPANNYSSFTIAYQASWGEMYGCKMFHGMYKVHTDSLNDYGQIEFSPDNGQSWYDIFHDTIFGAAVQYYSPKPVFTGKSNIWRYFDVVFADLPSVFNIQFGDTLMFRFSFTSDSIFDNLDGLVFDNIGSFEFVEGISEIRFKPIHSKIFPNPSGKDFTIDFENPDCESFELAVYDINSKLIHIEGSIKSQRVYINGDIFTPGTYFYKLTNLKDKKRAWGKFVKL